MENGIERLSESVRKYNNKKTILAIVSVILVVGIGIASAIPEFALSTEEIRTAKFWTNTIVNIIVGLTSYVCFALVGQTSKATNQASNYFKARSKFVGLSEDILKNRCNEFRQWINKIFHPSQQKEKDLSLLHSVGITNIKYLDLDIEEIKNLETVGTTKFKKLTKEQVEMLVAIKTGKSAIHFCDYNTYLSENKSFFYQVPAERIANQTKTTIASVSAMVLSRIILMCGLALVLGLISWKTIEDISDGERTATIVYNIIARLFTSIFNSYRGYYDGGKFTDRDAEYLNDKISIIYRFKDDKSFKALSEEEEAKEEFVAYVKEQEKENSKKIGIRNGDGKQEVAIIPQK